MRRARNATAFLGLPKSYKMLRFRIGLHENSERCIPRLRPDETDRSVPTSVLLSCGVGLDMVNKHFEDARYYLKRAGETAKAGVAEEVSAVEERFRELTGREEEPEDSRLEDIKSELAELQERAEGEANEAIEDARERIEEYRAEA